MTRKKYSAEENVQIVLKGLRGETSVAALCRREGIPSNLYYRWSKDFLEAGKQRLVGDSERQADSRQVSEMRAEVEQLKQLVAELVYASGKRKAYLIPILDHASKVVLGLAVGERAVTSLRAHRMDLSPVAIHHDQDPVFTNYTWTARLLLKDQVRVSYALGGAQDKAEMEAFNSRFKTEYRSLLLDAQSSAELKQLVAERMVYYNNVRRHSSIGYRAPSQFIATLPPWS